MCRGLSFEFPRLFFVRKKTSSSAGGSEIFSYTQKKEPSNIHSATAKKHYEKLGGSNG